MTSSQPSTSKSSLAADRDRIKNMMRNSSGHAAAIGYRILNRLVLLATVATSPVMLWLNSAWWIIPMMAGYGLMSGVSKLERKAAPRPMLTKFRLTLAGVLLSVILTNVTIAAVLLYKSPPFVGEFTGFSGLVSWAAWLAVVLVGPVLVAYRAGEWLGDKLRARHQRKLSS